MMRIEGRSGEVQLPDPGHPLLAAVGRRRAASDTTVGILHGTFSDQIKAEPRLATSKSPKPAIKGKTRTVVSIDVKVPGMDPKGWAAVKIGKKQYKGKLVDGQVKIELPKFNKVGKQKLKVKYLGNDHFKRAFKFINLWVVR